MNIGESIINEIIKQKMVRPYGEPDTVLVWNANAAEQLECLIQELLRKPADPSHPSDSSNPSPR